MTVQERADEISARSAGRMIRLQEKTNKIVRSQISPERKYIRLVEISNEAKSIIDPSTPCRRGCSFCCHIALPISLSEARTLEIASGRKLLPSAAHAPASDNANAAVAALEENIGRFQGKPCPFLVKDECSVYDSRPICRTHHVIEADNSKCDVSLGRKPVRCSISPGSIPGQLRSRSASPTLTFENSFHEDHRSCGRAASEALRFWRREALAYRLGGSVRHPASHHHRQVERRLDVRRCRDHSAAGQAFQS